MAGPVNLTVRGVATGLALGLATYFAARALWWLDAPEQPPLFLASVALFGGTVALLLLAGMTVSRRLPLWACLGVVCAVALIPAMTNLSLDERARVEPFATWYIGATGLLAVVCIVRRRAAFGWLCVAVLSVSSAFWLGAQTAFERGVFGSIVWAILAQLLVFFWDRAVRDTERLAKIQQSASAWRRTQEVRRRERRERVQFALSVAGPVLARVIASKGNLAEEERAEARRAEGRLRDELRGGILLNDAVRDAIAGVREGGGSVTVFDEGGIDDLPEEERARIRDELARVLSGKTSGRVIIRAARHPSIAVTVVGRTGVGEWADDDAVDLWHEIPRIAE